MSTPLVGDHHQKAETSTIYWITMRLMAILGTGLMAIHGHSRNTLLHPLTISALWHFAAKTYLPLYRPDQKLPSWSLLGLEDQEASNKVKRDGGHKPLALHTCSGTHQMLSLISYLLQAGTRHIIMLS